MVRASHRLGFAVAALLAAAGGCADPGPDPRLEQPRMQHQVEELALGIGARQYNSPAAHRAADTIVSELARIGWPVERLPVGHIIHPPLVVLGRPVFPRHHVDVNDANLLVRVRPADPARARDPAILLMAHYDTVPGSPGAVDNAAAAALLLDLARILSAEPPPRPVFLVWTAAEEMRLSGATKLVEAIGPEVGVAISLDLVGASDVVTLNGLSELIGRPWLARLAAAARTSGNVRAPAIYRLVSRRLPETERSDHGPFTARGIPAFHLYSRGADRIYLPYHSRFDTPDRIDWRGVLTAGTFLLAFIEDDRPLPAAGGDAGWWLDLPGGPRVLPLAALLAVESLLAAMAIAGLAILFRRHRHRQRAAVQPDPPLTPQRRLHGRGLLGFALVYGFAWLAVGAMMAIARRVHDHPAPWLHAPGAAYLVWALLAAAVALPMSWLCGRLSPPAATGDRFLAAAIVLFLLAAVPLVAVAAPELALRPLLSAALLGLAAVPRRARFALAPALMAMALPLALLDPGLAREGFFHEFLPIDFPVVAALAAVLAPTALVVVWAWRCSGRELPARGRAVLLVTAVPAVIAFAIVALHVSAAPSCSGAHLARSGLFCEINGD